MRSSVIFLGSIYLALCLGQYNHCLRPAGCWHNECCFSIVDKTGPVCDLIPGCAAQFKPHCCRNTRPVYTDYGTFYGYAILLDDPYGYRENGRKYLEIWRGIPYARPPTKENNLRFRKPLPLAFSNTKHDAMNFRDSCAQPIESSFTPFADWSKSPYEWRRRLHFPQTMERQQSISEDCLYLNIYVVNETDLTSGSPYSTLRRKLPIMVFLDGEDHLVGTANQYTGHALAQLGLVVIFVNYRLGPFGYLATGSGIGAESVPDDDRELLGNYALWDQVKALEFIRENADKFFGDPDRITLVGHGSAAADVALHLLSRHSGRRRPPLFHQAILMSGSDQMEGGFVRTVQESAVYAAELSRQVGCASSHKSQMLTCLRSRSWSEVAAASAKTRLHRPNWLTKPWSPTLDGEFLEDWPETLWATGQFAHIPLIGGMTSDASALHALSSIFRVGDKQTVELLRKLLFKEVHPTVIPNPDFKGTPSYVNRQAFQNMADADFAKDIVSVAETLTFYYSDWSNLTNPLLQWASFRKAWTDRMVGSGLVQTLRAHSNVSMGYNRTQMYVFAYAPSSDPWTPILGSYGGSELKYLFGMPRLSELKTREELEEEWPSNLGLAPPVPTIDQADINITDYMLYFISSFVKSGNATPNPVKNFTWDTYRSDNRTYLWINLSDSSNKTLFKQNEILSLRQNYRVYEFAFWRQLYPRLLIRSPVLTYPEPTPSYVLDYQVSSLILIGILIILLILVMTLSILYYRKRRMIL